MHPIRTERRKSPLCMFSMSRLQLGDAIEDLPEDVLRYGADWNGPIPYEEEHVVFVPPIRNPLTYDEFQELQDHIQPYEDERDIGEQLYIRCRSFVRNKLDDY